jgi:excisionase family DNA binding protein
MAVTPDILTPAEAARISRYSVKTIYRAIQSGRLPASRPTARYRIRSADLAIWLGAVEDWASAPVDLPPPSAPAEVGSLGRLRALEADAA